MTTIHNAPSILYCGDTHLRDAASYLGGVMTHFGWRFDYVSSDQKLTSELASAPRKIVILSDYPASRLSADVADLLLQQVSRGTGLLMIGGWESFHGSAGDWHNSPIAQALPVEIASCDDRVNADQPCLISRRLDHPAIAQLPWDGRPPYVGGFNRVTARSTATVLLETQRLHFTHSGDTWRFEPGMPHPLLVVGTYSAGRTAALMTDLAPHWVAGFVDWGPARVIAQAPGGNEVEVGDWYASFIRHLLTWIANDPLGG